MKRTNVKSNPEAGRQPALRKSSRTNSDCSSCLQNLTTRTHARLMGRGGGGNLRRSVMWVGQSVLWDHKPVSRSQITPSLRLPPPHQRMRENLG